jgi:hypothetical protein
MREDMDFDDDGICGLHDGRLNVEGKRTKMTAHAKLSASGSEKWMTCTPSANLEAQFPDEGSEFAREGSFAHQLFEMEINYILERLTGKEYKARRAALMKNAFYSQELEDYVQEAVDFAVGRIEQIKFDCKDPVIMVEQRLDFSRWVPEGFGTGDLVIVADGIVEVMDLKYGKGIYVDPIHNSQLRLYGLGAINELSHLYDIFRVRMTVLQPRLHNYGTEEIQAEDLLDWAIYTKSSHWQTWRGWARASSLRVSTAPVRFAKPGSHARQELHKQSQLRSRSSVLLKMRSHHCLNRFQWTGLQSCYPKQTW